MTAPSRPAPTVPTPLEPGTTTLGRPRLPMVRARAAPSAAAPVACRLGDVVVLGPRIPITGKPDLEAVGHAIHAILAADRLDLAAHDRLALATELLAAHGVGAHLDPTEILGATTRLWRWLDVRFRGARVHREWPLVHRLGSGTVVTGVADLVLAEDAGYAVIDHKTFPGASEAAAERALGYSGQLAAYAAAIRAATGAAITSTWIHFPVRGRLVELRLGEAA